MSPRARFLPRLARFNNKRTWLTPEDFDDSLVLAYRKEKIERRLKRQSQKTKWQHTGDGFAYAPGPVIHKQWHQFTRREVAVYASRWLMLYLLIVIIVNLLDYFNSL